MSIRIYINSLFYWSFSLGGIQILLAQMSFKDLVDISIVAVLIYQALLIIHGTRAVQILIGIGFLFILFWFGLSFKFYSLNWILSHFFDSFFIIAIVLFQDQIRALSYGRYH